jgi:hypothetical protein
MKTKRFLHRWLAVAAGGGLLATAGCVGYVGPGYYDGGVYGPGYFDDYGPDVTIFGGGYGHRDHDFGRRGFQSRGGGHGGHGGGHR